MKKVRYRLILKDSQTNTAVSFDISEKKKELKPSTVNDLFRSLEEENAKTKQSPKRN